MTAQRPKRPTMNDVAGLAGVSLKTVSRVVNQEPSVAPALAAKVREAVKELGYRHNRLASSLRSGRSTATIGLTIEEIANPFYAAITAVIADYAAARDTLLITASPEENPDDEQRLLRDLCSRRVDGLVVVPASSEHSYLREEVELGLPVVFLDRPAGGLEADTVLLDNYGGAHQAVSDLIARGHRDVAVLLDRTDVYTMRERLRGARQAADEAGLGGRLMVREAVRDPETAATAVADLLDGPRPPSAFFSVNNRITVGALHQLWRMGSDAALSGFDDFELAHLMPREFRVVAYDARALARRAVELLFARIGGDRSAPQTITLPTRLEPRGLR